MELRFVNREGDSLVFETADGQRLRAVIDDAVKEALRRPNPEVSKGISPRDVQSAIRSGESITDLASRLGVPEEVVEPFAAPILDELRFMLQTALSVSLSAQGRMRSFEELVQEVYPGSTFSISKDGETWVLISGNSLKWHFEPKQRLIEPVSESAKELAKSFATDRQVIRSAPRSEQSAEAPAPATSSTSGESAGASVHDLVQELRARRNTEETKPASAKGRAALPSWDEIVLGTGKLESEADQRDS